MLHRTTYVPAPAVTSGGGKSPKRAGRRDVGDYDV
jgi:hypothetical protein